jgi:hypothetical protein
MNKDELSPDEIRAFWNWFSLEASHLADLLARSATEELVRIVDPRMKSLDERIGWEFGPGAKRENAFSISLNGSITNLPIAEAIIKAAPDLPKWEFNAGRPPKAWDGRFKLQNPEGQAVSLDASKWRYVLTAFDDGAFFDISIIAQLPSMDERAKTHAARVAIQGVVGERSFLERFDRVEFADSPTPEILERSTPLFSLNEHIQHLDSIRHDKP